MLCSLIASVLILQGAPGRVISPEAKSYLDKVLGIIEKNSIRHDVSFSRIREVAYESAKSAAKPEDTYPAIHQALETLADGHSFFLDPKRATINSSGRRKWAGFSDFEGVILQIRTDGPAYKAGLRRGMTIYEVDGAKPKDKRQTYKLVNAAQSKGRHFNVRAGFRRQTARLFHIVPAETPIWYPPESKVLDGAFGYVLVPAFSGSNADGTAFATLIQQGLAAADRRKLKGWIVDLRLNLGGDMYPMIAGLGPILGERVLGFFVDRSTRINWSYRHGASVIADQKVTAVPQPLILKNQKLPIAVLTSPFTASSGEATLISFLGDPRVRTFGTPTYGVPTANRGFPLADGAVLYLCVGYEQDRTGKSYKAAIPPDVLVAQDWLSFNTPRDRTLTAAKQWINRRRP